MRTANGRYEIEREHKGVVKTYTTSYTRTRDVTEADEDGKNAWFGSLDWAREGQEHNGACADVYKAVGELEDLREGSSGKFVARVKEDAEGMTMEHWDEGVEQYFETEEEAVAWVEGKLGLR